MDKCVIFTGGIINDYSFIDKSELSDCLIICADAGYLHAKKLGLKTDIIVGDFDTLNYVPDEVPEVIRHMPEKDDTDTMLAIRTAVDRGFKDIVMYGALGGRFDHSFANIQTLAFAMSCGAECKIITENEIIFMIKNTSVDVRRKVGFSLSLFSYGDVCEGVSENGVKYPLDNATLTHSFPLGVCNEIIEDIAHITVKDGKMLIIQSKI